MLEDVVVSVDLDTTSTNLCIHSSITAIPSHVAASCALQNRATIDFINPRESGLFTAVWCPAFVVITAECGTGNYAIACSQWNLELKQASRKRNISTINVETRSGSM